MADNGLFVGRGCDPADLFGSEVAQFEHGRVRSIYGGAAYRYLVHGGQYVNLVADKMLMFCTSNPVFIYQYSWTSCSVQVSDGIIRGITTINAKMNTYITCFSLEKCAKCWGSN